MSTASDTVASIKDKIAANRAEMARLRKEHEFLLSQLRAFENFYEVSSQPRSARRKRNDQSGSERGYFEPKPGGASETLIALVAAGPGEYDRRALIDRALLDVVTTSKNPRKTIDQTLRQLMKPGNPKVYEDNDGKLYPSGGGPLLQEIDPF